MSLSLETLDAASKLRAMGLVWTEVAAQLGVSRTTLHRDMIATGRIVPAQRRRSIASWPKHAIRDAHRRCVSGERMCDVAASLGISAEALRTQFQRKGFPALTKPKQWSAKVVKEAFADYRAGESRESIAARLDTTWDRLHRTFTRMGLKTREIAHDHRRYDDLGRKAWQLRVKGQSYREIAAALNVGTKDPEMAVGNAIRKYCARYGVKMPPRDIATSRAKRGS
jgi:orotate phosphoribosyltransferase-like protein